MSACYGAGFLNFIANPDELSEEDCVALVAKVIQEVAPDWGTDVRVRDVFKDGVGSWLYSRADRSVTFGWLGQEEAAPILSFVETTKGSAPYSDFGNLGGFDFLYPDDFLDDRKLVLKVPGYDDPVHLTCASMCMTKTMLRLKLDEIRTGKAEGVVSCLDERILRDLVRCEEYDLMYSIR